MIKVYYNLLSTKMDFEVHWIGKFDDNKREAALTTII